MRALCEAPTLAIYHLSASIVKRSAGRSIIAAAAYRAGAKIEDRTTGLIHNYKRKKGVAHSEIITPINTDNSEWITDREQLWNAVEVSENRKDSALAREITLALPVELDRANQIALVREYVRANFTSLGMVADFSLHHVDGDNPHCHILLTTRNLEVTPEGVRFGLKNREWDNRQLLIDQRQSWQNTANKYLAAAGLDVRIDCRSLADQGSEFEPQIHLGVHAAAMRRKGLATDRSEEFDRIQAANDDIRARLERVYQEEHTEPELNEADNKRKEKDHRLAELIIEVMKENPYPRSKREADIAKRGLRRDYSRFDSSHSNRHYSVILKTRKNVESIEVRLAGARPRLFTFEKEDNKWIKKTFYNKTAFPETFSPDPFLKERIDNAVKDFNENTIARCYHKLQKVRIEDEKLQLKENKLGKLIIDLSEKLQSERFYIEPYYIYADKNEILIGEGRSSLYYPSPFELKSDSQGNFTREYIQHDRDEESIINYFTEIIVNYQNELQVKEKLSSSIPIPIIEELAISETKEIDLELQVVKEGEIKEVTKVQQPTRKITQKKKRDRGGY